MRFTQLSTVTWRGQYNATTGDVRLNRSSWSNSGGTFVMRVEVSGNETTGAFQARVIRRSSASSMTLIAAGSSSEASATNHYVVKLRYDAGSNDPDTGTVKWLCILSQAEEADFADYATTTSKNSATNYYDASYKVEQRDDSNFVTAACNGSDHITTVNAQSFFVSNDAPYAVSGGNWDTPLF